MFKYMFYILNFLQERRHGLGGDEREDMWKINQEESCLISVRERYFKEVKG